MHGTCHTNSAGAQAAWNQSDTYTDRGWLKSVTVPNGSSPVTVNYLYNGLEQRTYKAGPSSVVPSGAAYYVYDEQGQLLGEYNASGVPIYEVIWLNDLPVGVIKQTRTGSGSTLNVSTQLGYIYADHLNSPRVITRGSPSTDHRIVWRWDSTEPFGVTPANENPNGAGAYSFNLRFPGQVFDKETGLHQNWHREFEGWTGRYTQSDPIGLEGGINTYSYVGSNPLKFTDPLGLVKQSPNSAYCQDLRKRIQSGRDEIAKRLQELEDDKLGLPERLASPNNEGFAGTRRGHRTLINIRDSQTRRLEKKYDDDCGGDDDSSNSCEVCPSGSTVATAVGAGVSAYVAYRCVRMLPSLLPPLWWTIPANVAAP